MCVWCAGTCNHLTVSGTSLSKGPDLVVHPGYTPFVAVSGLGSGSAVMCYSDGSNSGYNGAKGRDKAKGCTGNAFSWRHHNGASDRYAHACGGSDRNVHVHACVNMET